MRSTTLGEKTMLIKEPITSKELEEMFIKAFSSPYTEYILIEPLPKNIKSEQTTSEEKVK